jgi:hypothetical protein
LPNPGQFIQRILRAANPDAPELQGEAGLTESTGTFLTNLVGGLGNFVYERAKVEAGFYLTRQLKGDLCGDQYRPFFGNLCVAFDNIDFGVSLTALGSYLAAAARKDLERFPDIALVYGIHRASKSTSDFELEKQRKLVLNALFSARITLTYFQAVAEGRHPLDVARALRRIEFQTKPPAIYSSLQFGSELLDAMLRQKRLSALDMTNMQVARCYAISILLTLEQARIEDLELSTDDPFEFGSRPERLAGLNGIFKTLQDLLNSTTDIRERLDAARSAAVKTHKPTVDSNDGGFRPPNVVGDGDRESAGRLVQASPTNRDYWVAVDQTLELILVDSQALADALGLEEVAAGFAMSAATTQLGALLIARDNAGETVVSIVALLSELDRNLGIFGSPAMAKVKRMLPFASQLAQAKTADEVANVIEAAAVPPSMYEVKSQRRFVALNALVGVGGGQELVDIGKTSSSGVTGAFAPVGIHATTPTSFGHMGGFLSIANLGTTVSARFSADTQSEPDDTQTKVEKTVKVDLINILAPGLFLTFGLGHSPFVLGLGGQVVPARSITKVAADGSKESQTTPAVQGLVFAAIDVPIFGL